MNKALCWLVFICNCNGTIGLKNRYACCLVFISNCNGTIGLKKRYACWLLFISNRNRDAVSIFSWGGQTFQFSFDPPPNNFIPFLMHFDFVNLYFFK